MRRASIGSGRSLWGLSGGFLLFGGECEDDVGTDRCMAWLEIYSEHMRIRICKMIDIRSIFYGGKPSRFEVMKHIQLNYLEC